MLFDDETPSDSSEEVTKRLEKISLAILAGAAYGRRVGHSIKPDKDGRFTRFRTAVKLVNINAKSKLLNTLENKHSVDLPTVESWNFNEDNASTLRGRFTDDECIALLLTAHTSNPVTPYEIHIKNPEREWALKAFAQDIGAKKTFPDFVLSSVQTAVKCHQSSFSPTKIALLLAGVALIAVAPALVAAVAPAGLAGGAAIVAGLSALGPGGMLGGLAVVSVVGATGSSVATGALTLTAGSREAVQSNVIFLHAMALIDHRRYPYKHEPPKAVLVLQAMQSELLKEITSHESLDDKGSQPLKELKSKLNDIDKSLSCLHKDGLGSVEAITKDKGK